MSELKKEEISEQNFKDSNSNIIFQSDFNRKYFKLSNKINEFLIGCQSDLVNPEVLNIKKNIYSIGIDEHFAIYDIEKQESKLIKNLDYNYCKSFLFGNRLFIASELLVYVLDLESWKLVCEYPLSDIFDDFIKKEGVVYAKDISNNIYTLKSPFR